MNVFLWVLQAVLAAMFAMAGVMKSTQPKDKLAEKLAWVTDFSPATARSIGIVEFAAALGLTLAAWSPGAASASTASNPRHKQCVT